MFETEIPLHTLWVLVHYISDKHRLLRNKITNDTPKQHLHTLHSLSCKTKNKKKTHSIIFRVINQVQWTMCTPLPFNKLTGLCCFIYWKIFFLDVKALNDIWSFKTCRLLRKLFKIAYCKNSGMMCVEFVICVGIVTPSESKQRLDAKGKKIWKEVTTAAETYNGEKRRKIEGKIEGVEGEVSV